MTTKDGARVKAGDDLYRITTVGDGPPFAQGVNKWWGKVPYFAEQPGEPDTPERVEDCFSTRALARSAIEVSPRSPKMTNNPDNPPAGKEKA